MRSHQLFAFTAAFLGLAATTTAQSSSDSSDSSLAAITLTGSNTASVTSTGADYPTGSEATYATLSGTSTITATSAYGSITDLASVIASVNSTATGNSSDTQTTSKASQTVLVGSGGSSSTSLNATGNATASSTSTAAAPTNTVPCNGYSEFCTRSYSNITMVAAHNSPFIKAGNAAANQMLDVTTQLNDGIRMLQFQAHLENDTMYLCHTSCDLLNAGTLEDYLSTVTQWLQQHPTDVITILMGNYAYVDPGNFTAPVTNSGLINYVYTPPENPMVLSKWPTLGEMILRNERAVVLLDYQANQSAIPWLLDEFTHMWETPFSPTDRDFPCTEQRPPNQARNTNENTMYIANHNLNVDIALAGISLDVPAYTILNETNGVSGYGSAGLTVENCTANWNRPPNFLLVDYYNLGNFNGSVFQVAATANNVTYNKNSCCGSERKASAGVSIQPASWGMILFISVASMMLL